MEENCRNQLYLEEGNIRKINRKKICCYLKKLEKNGMIIKLNI